MKRALHAIVHGRVQGVGFRYAAREAARALGLCGWVRNQSDGSVELHAEGAADALARFEAWLAKGPPGAAVERIDRREDEAADADEFEIRR